MASTAKTRAEQETTIRWDEEEKGVHVWTASPVTLRKLARLGIRETRPGGFFVIPLARFRWGLKRSGSGGGHRFGSAAPVMGGAPSPEIATSRALAAP
jgi:hypothetical protein